MSHSGICGGVMGFILRISDKSLESVQNKSVQFAQHSGGSDWESLAQRRKISSMCALYKASTGESAWKAIGDRLQAPSYVCRVDQYLKIRARKKKKLEILLCE